MSFLPVIDGRVALDVSSNSPTDVYLGGIRFSTNGAARATTAVGTFFNQGIPMSESGQVSIVDATTGLPANTIYHNGLPISGDRICISYNAATVVSSGIPFDAAGAVAVEVSPITFGPTLDLVFAGIPADEFTGVSIDLAFTAATYEVAAQYSVWE